MMYESVIDDSSILTTLFLHVVDLKLDWSVVLGDIPVLYKIQTINHHVGF